MLDLDLRGFGSSLEIESAVSRLAAMTRAGQWIRGFGWDGGTEPHDVAFHHPVFLARRDGHAAWVNTAARAELGLDGDRAVLSEATFDAVRRRLPARSTGERVAAVGKRLAELAAYEIDAVDDMVEAWAPEVYALLRDDGALQASVGMWLPEDLPVADAEAIRRAFPEADPELSVRGVKIFLDGTLEARTAALSQPYADEPGTSGALRIDANEIRDRVMRWAERGWPVALHAIGDRAVTLALDALGSVRRPRAGSHRIEHAQVMRRLDLPRFAELGVIASVQPGHWRDDRLWLNARLGERPGVLIHPLASLARSGATLLIGSDWPVSGWDPVAILQAASDPDRGEEAVRTAEARAWYTSGPR